MLQTRTIEPGTLELLKQLMAVPEIAPFYLVGGTALALQLGHRVSIDLDLFTLENFDKTNLIESLSNDYNISIEAEGTSMLITYINEIKVDFVKMAYPVLFPPLYVEGIRMLEIRDIAPMKLKAIAQRGSKKDFFDIYYLLQKMPMETLLHLFKKKFKQHEVFHIVKSLSYFADAEQYSDPIVFDKAVTWSKVKSTVGKAVDNLFQ
ncbi:MAG TPA: hypothetical protein ENJ95_06325 [Bacteroidetes bacterium]|nr:hypothetical protein [Bacteroidota bacterium]